MSTPFAGRSVTCCSYVTCRRVCIAGSTVDGHAALFPCMRGFVSCRTNHAPCAARRPSCSCGVPRLQQGGFPASSFSLPALFSVNAYAYYCCLGSSQSRPAGLSKPKGRRSIQKPNASAHRAPLTPVSFRGTNYRFVNVTCSCHSRVLVTGMFACGQVVKPSAAFLL